MEGIDEGEIDEGAMGEEMPEPEVIQPPPEIYDEGDISYGLTITYRVAALGDLRSLSQVVFRV
jgi:hypothetical protein